MPARLAALLSCLLLAAACSSDSSPDDLADDDRAGEVEAVEGRVVAERAGDEVVLAIGDDVLAGDTIVTAEDASITVRLLHNEARWTLEGGKRRAVRASAAWRAPKSSGGGEANDRTGAAGRQAEREAADTRATALRAEGTADEAGGTPHRLRGGESDDEDPDPTGGLDGFGGDDGRGLGITGKGGRGGGIGDGTVGDIGSGGGRGPADETRTDEEVPRARVSLEATVSGSLAEEVVRRTVRSRVGMIRACYERSLKADGPDSGGRLVVTFVIQPGGKVARANVNVESGSFSKAMTGCVMRRVRKLRFPAADGATTVTVPFVFRRGT